MASQEKIPIFVFETRAEPSNMRACTPAKTNRNIGDDVIDIGRRSGSSSEPGPYSNSTFNNSSGDYVSPRKKIFVDNNDSNNGNNGNNQYDKSKHSGNRGVNVKREEEINFVKFGEYNNQSPKNTVRESYHGNSPSNQFASRYAWGSS